MACNAHPPAKPPFPFLSLPSELRNNIYRLLLTSSSPEIASSPNILLTRTSNALLNIHPALLLTCRQINAEATSILYAENRFQAHPTWLTDMTFALDPGRPIVSTRCVGMIRRWHLRVRLDCDAYYGSERLVKAFSGCEEMQIEGEYYQS